MAVKQSYHAVVLAAAVVVVASLQVAASPFHQPHAEAEHAEDEHHHGPPRSYHFQYAVHDPITGDVKSQNEVSDGHGTVKGTYSLVEADGSTRVVEYTADDEHGFNAEVKRIEPQVQHHKPAYKSDYAPATEHHEDVKELAPVAHVVDAAPHYYPETYSY